MSRSAERDAPRDEDTRPASQAVHISQRRFRDFFQNGRVLCEGMHDLLALSFVDESVQPYQCTAPDNDDLPEEYTTNSSHQSP